MKKILLTILIVLSSFCFLCACSSEPSNPTNKDFTGITFESQTIDYDGAEHTIVATGMPQGASVNYTNAGPYVLPGSYEIGVEISAQGYNTYTKTVTLTINKINFTGITFESQTIDYDGAEHTIVATGMPQGASVNYTNAGPYVLPGSYEIGVEISAQGYNTYTKTVTLTINKINFTGITFESQTIDYDGSEHTIVATGMPQGASVNYTNAGPHKNADTYTISVSISAQGYNTFTKSVELKINKIDFPSTITFNDKKVMYTGSEKTILVEGDLPQGTSIQYTNNTGTAVGSYDAVAVLTNPNYNTKTLNATLTIYNVVQSAKTTIDKLLNRPEPWTFMPEAFGKESLATTSNPVKDFNNFVNVDSINRKFMGKQMYVLWEGVYNMDAMLAKFDTVYAVGETIATVYQNFINDNPDNYAEWTNTVAGFKIKILLNGNQSQMLIGNSVFSLELFADSDEGIYKGRIDIASGGILNYEMSEDYLKFNLSLTIKGVLVMKQVEFVRNEDDTVFGYFYEYAGLKSVALKTSAVIAFNEDYAIVMSAKRESEDLLINGYEEVYSSTTGMFLSAEVLENNKLVDFDTYWVNLWDVGGINSIKAVRNGQTSLNDNLHDIYVNGSSTILGVKKNTLLGVPTSRKYDIEMKTVYYVVATNEGGEVVYTVQETQIPMLFVQTKNAEDFTDDIISQNKNLFTTTPTLPLAKLEIAQDNFEDLYEILEKIKETLTYDELESQLGTKNSFFDEE